MVAVFCLAHEKVAGIDVSVDSDFGIGHIDSKKYNDETPQLRIYDIKHDTVDLI